MAIVKLTADFVKSASVEPGKSRTIYWDKHFCTFTHDLDCIGFLFVYPADGCIAIVRIA